MSKSEFRFWFIFIGPLTMFLSVLLALMISPPWKAHADDSSYLAAVGGIYHLWSPDQMLHLGHGICDELRKGRTAEQQIGLAPPAMSFDVDVPGVVYAAQRELCPTLGH